MIWPDNWQQEARDALLPYIGQEVPLDVLVGDPASSISGSLISGYFYVEADDLIGLPRL